LGTPADIHEQTNEGINRPVALVTGVSLFIGTLLGHMEGLPYWGL